MSHFFISRAGEDREWAAWIAAVLEAAGHTTTFQDRDFQPGQSFVEQMQLALERADFLIAVLSPHYLGKDFPLRELYSAIAGKRPIIPVRVAPCDPPHPIKDIIILDFVGKDEAQREQLLVDSIRPDPFVEKVSPTNSTPATSPPSPKGGYFGSTLSDIYRRYLAAKSKPDLRRTLFEVLQLIGSNPSHPEVVEARLLQDRIESALSALPAVSASALPQAFIRKLPTVDPNVFGRDAQLALLEQSWSNPHTNFLQIIAPGGAGKTALMTRWYRRHLDDATIFGWSFYSQGTSDKSQTSSDPFFAAALPWFGITVPPTASIYEKVDLLVARLRQERALLILDGVEPLQDPEGSLRDLALKALLQELAARNAGLVLVTTRVRLSDVPDEAPRALSLDLENLDPADGARYLAHLGVRGPEDDLRAASEAYENHALALTLLGTYLVTFCDADIRRRADIKELQVDDIKPGRHARKVMASYALMYEGQPELAILRALGYFNRPAEPEALKLVLPAMGDRKYRAALKRLHDARLVLTTDPAQPLDCHPLVREHFAADATPEGHARLYEHYKEQAPKQPDTLEKMTPLFYAVYHGCQAGRHQAALDDVFADRIHRKQFFLTTNLGAFGTFLSLLANFFETPWTRPVAALSPADQSRLVGQAGFTLRVVGRLADALEPMRTAAEAAARSEDWNRAATNYNNLSELHLTLGNVPAAVEAAHQAVGFADRSLELSQQMRRRADLAWALLQSGDLDESMRLFDEAERLQEKHEPAYPILYRLQGYQYCDILSGQGQTAKVVRRASQTLDWATRRYLGAFFIGLDHLSLGRAHPSGSAEAANHLDQAVDFLRGAERLDYLPLALLARGTPHDLEEVFRIATRSGMRLYLADYHLAKGNLDEAERLINETGYHRRDPELAALRAKKATP